ncbi:MAG: hypothetical protein ACPLPV_00155, partial [Methanomassiliicoccales archaeon]
MADQMTSLETRLMLIEREVERLRKVIEGNGDSLEGRLRKEMDNLRSSYSDISQKLAGLDASIERLSQDYREHAERQNRREDEERSFLRHLNLQTALIIVSILLSLIMNLMP